MVSFTIEKDIDMLKKERLVKIAHKVNQNGIITIKEIMDELGVSDMTARRDLDELEKSGKLLRVHGGAQSLSFSMDHELSHIEKSSVQISEGESIFLGPGTTIQFLAEQLTGRNIRVITNSLAVFNILVNHAPTEVILTGGDYRDNTNTFVGPITNLVLGKLKYNKSFISCNGIYNSSITTYSLEEGESQQIALDNSKNKYLLADNKKFNRADFYIYYDLFNFDTLITDNTIDDEVLSHYKQYVQIMTV